MTYLTQPPDPSPRKPKLQLPAGACDTHFHLFGPAEKYPFDPSSTYTSADALPETLFALQAVLGLERGVLVSGGGYGRDTRHLLDTLKRFPDRLRGIALPPEDLAAEEIRRMDALGVRGVRFVSGRRRPGLPTLSEPLALRAYESAGWQVHFYPGDDLVQEAPRLLALPNTIVLDHFAGVKGEQGMAQPAFKTLLGMLESGRVWVKLSGPMRCVAGDFPYAAMTPFARELAKHAPERFVWGSDWPHVNMNGRGMPNDGDLVDLLGEWVPDASVRKRILVDNPVTLFGF